MPLILTDEQLKEANLTEQEARIELACRLFDAGKLHLWPAAKLAGLSRVEMENELITREIPIYRPTLEDIEHDLRAMAELRKQR